MASVSSSKYRLTDRTSRTMRYHHLTENERLDEEIHGNMAIVYHRTKMPSAIESIENAGFRAGDGAAYGEAIYTTFDLPSQMNERMLRLYGRYIVRCKLNLNGFIIFNPVVSEMVYGRQASLANQFARHRLAYDPLKWKEPEYGLSTDYARKLAAIPGITERIPGFLYNGAGDGAVAVCYDPSRLIPFAYLDAGEDFLDAVDAQGLEGAVTAKGWTRMNSKAAIKRQHVTAAPHGQLMSLLGKRETPPDQFLRAFNHVLQRAEGLPEDLVKQALHGAFFDHQDDPGFRTGISPLARQQMEKLRARDFPEGFPWEDLDSAHVS